MMSANKIKLLWAAWIAITLIIIGYLVYTKLFYNAAGKELLERYALLDAQLSQKALFAKSFFAVCEALCFSILCYCLREIAIENIKLNVAFGVYFALSMVNLFDAFSGNYFSFEGIRIEISFASGVLIIGLTELKRRINRGKHY